MSTFKIKNLIYICAYFGSKLRFMKELTVLIPKDCNVMYEVCGGLGAFILNRYWCFNRSVYNEYNEKIYNLVSILKNIDTRDRFINEIEDIPNNKESFDKALCEYTNDFPNIKDKVEQAKIVYMLLKESYNCEKKNWIKREINKNKKNNIKKRLKKVSEALENIDINNGDCFEIIENNKNNKEVWIYADVPYPQDTERISENSYDNEKYDWPLKLHQDFVNKVKGINSDSGCKILICTYDSPTYNKLLEETDYWHKIQIKKLPSPSGKKGKKRNIRIEYAYVNYTNYSELAKYIVIPIK